MKTTTNLWEKGSAKSRMMSLILASKLLLDDWQSGGEKGSLDFYGAMFALDNAIMVKNKGEKVEKSIKDAMDRAYEVGCIIMSTWKPLAEDLPINRDTACLFYMALADVGMYPGGNEDVNKDAVLRARDDLYKVQEILVTKARQQGG